MWKQCPSSRHAHYLGHSLQSHMTALSMWWGCHWCNIFDRQLCFSLVGGEDYEPPPSCGEDERNCAFVFPFDIECAWKCNDNVFFELFVTCRLFWCHRMCFRLNRTEQQATVSPSRFVSTFPSAVFISCQRVDCESHLWRVHVFCPCCGCRRAIFRDSTPWLVLCVCVCVLCVVCFLDLNELRVVWNAPRATATFSSNLSAREDILFGLWFGVLLCGHGVALFSRDVLGGWCGFENCASVCARIVQVCGLNSCFV